MNPLPFGNSPGVFWPTVFYPPQELKAGENKYAHKRRKAHHSNHTEPLCRHCRSRKVRGKCRTSDCKKKGS